MKYKLKNIVDALFDKEIDVLVQGCNCFCGFGRGLAKEILERIPEAYEADKKTTPRDKNKLGGYSFANLDNGGVVVNAYTQYHWIKKLNNEPKVKNGRGYILANYTAIESALNLIAKNYQGKKIGLPKIGAGWANGDWNIIEDIIKRTLIDKGFDVTIYVISKKDLK